VLAANWHLLQRLSAQHVQSLAGCVPLQAKYIILTKSRDTEFKKGLKLATAGDAYGGSTQNGNITIGDIPGAVEKR